MPLDPTAARSGAVFSTNPSYVGAWICYINGGEVPILGWEVTYGVGEITTASIRVFPEKCMERLGHEDRVQVALFYLDHWATPGKSEFRLMFDGEIIGWGYSHAGNARSITFSCVAHLAIFQQLYFCFINTMDDLVAAGNVESRNAITTAGFAYPYQLFHQGLIGAPLSVNAQNGAPPGVNEAPTAPAPGAPPGSTTAATADPNATHTSPVPASVPAPTPPPAPQYSSPNQVGTPPTATLSAPVAEPTTGDSAEGFTAAQPMINRPFDLVYNVIGGIISKQVPPSRRTAPMVNFFATHTRLTRFYNRWVALPLLEDMEAIDAQGGVFPIFRAARAYEALNALQLHAASRAGPAGPVWNLLQETLGAVLMEIGSVPTAPCVVVELGTSRILHELTPDLSVVDQHASAINAQYAESERDRLEEQITQAERQVAQIQRAQDATRPQLTSTTAPTAFDEDARVAQTYLQQLRLRLTALPAVTGPSASAAETAAGRPEGRVQSQYGVTPTTPVRLAQHFVKSPYYFAIPPMCNVFFPSMIQMWQYDEGYLNQPTRTYVNDSLMVGALSQSAQGITNANSNFIMQALSVGWPEEADRLLRQARGTGGSNARVTTATVNAQRDSGKDLLIFPEEFFKGPVIERQGIPPWFQMLKQFANGRSSPAAGAATGDVADSSLRPAPGVIGPSPGQLHYNQITNWPSQRGGWQRGHPTVYAASKIYGGSAPGQSANQWWYGGNQGQGMVGYSLRTMMPLVLEIPALALLGFCCNASQYDHAAWGSSGHTDIGYMGIDSLIGGQLGGWYGAILNNPANQTLLRSMMSAAGARNALPRGALAGEQTWPHPALDDIPGQIAVGIINMREWGTRVRAQLGFNPSGIRIPRPPEPLRPDANASQRARFERHQREYNTATAAAAADGRAAFNIGPVLGPKGGTTLWYAALIQMAWSGGAGATRAILAPYANRLKDVPEARRWGAFLEMLYTTAINGEGANLPGRPFMYTVGTLQKLEIGRIIARATGGPSEFFNEHLSGNIDREKLYNVLTLCAYRPYGIALATINQMYPGTVAAPAVAAAAALPVRPFRTRGGTLTNIRSTIAYPISIGYAPAVRVDREMISGNQGNYVSTDNAAPNAPTTTAPSTTGAPGTPTPPTTQTTTVNAAANPQPQPGQAVTPPVVTRTGDTPAAGSPTAPATSPDEPFYQPGTQTRVPNRLPARTTEQPIFTTANLDSSRQGRGVLLRTTTAIVDSEATENSPQAFADLFRNYAQHAFFVSRYSQRRATVAMTFNPYPVPGFPCVVFDKMTSEHHVVAYVQKITQSGSAEGGSPAMSTVANISYGRTFAEFMHNVQSDAVRFGERVMAAPAEIISEIRQVMQDEHKADQFYRRLLYGNFDVASQNPKPVSFRFVDVVAYETMQGNVDITMDGISVDMGEAEAQGRLTPNTPTPTPVASAAAADGTPTTVNSTPSTERNVNTNVDANQRIVPKAAYQEAFDSYDAAMRAVARPICTLAQYIRFWHGGMTLATLETNRQIKAGSGDYTYTYTTERDQEVVVRSSNNEESNVAVFGHGRTVRPTAGYWERIYKLRPGPGNWPTDGQQRYAPAPPPNYYAPSPALESIDNSFAQTRADWDVAIDYYREVVRKRVNSGQ